MKFFFIFIILFSVLVFLGCEKEDYEFGEIIVFFGLEVVVNIVGVDDVNFYGDGSGLVIFIVNVSDVIIYKYVFSDGIE